MTLRRGTYNIANEQTTRARADRMANRPKSLLHWLCTEYAIEAPDALHAHRLEEDGDPVMNGEARAWIGFGQGEYGGEWFGQDAQPNDYRRVACRTDVDGKYVTPTRAAIARIREPAERKLVGELACNVLYPLDVTRINGIPDWCRQDVVNAALERLWWNWRDSPMPMRGRPSESQAIAEAAVGV